jgi:hypothetical protein
MPCTRLRVQLKTARAWIEFTYTLLACVDEMMEQDGCAKPDRFAAVYTFGFGAVDSSCTRHASTVELEAVRALKIWRSHPWIGS